MAVTFTGKPNYLRDAQLQSLHAFLNKGKGATPCCHLPRGVTLADEITELQMGNNVVPKTNPIRRQKTPFRGGEVKATF